MMRIELMTSSLPRKRSTPELHRQLLFLSGRRDSNSRPLAWKANALSTELLPQYSFKFQVSSSRLRPNLELETWNFELLGGESRIRTYEGVRQQSYSLPQLATLVSPHFSLSLELSTCEPNHRFELWTPRLQITCSGQLS